MVTFKPKQEEGRYKQHWKISDWYEVWQFRNINYRFDMENMGVSFSWVIVKTLETLKY